MMKQKQRGATYGHHGQSIGSSREERERRRKRKKDLKESFLIQESEEERRKRKKHAEIKDPKLQQVAKTFREETDVARSRKAPAKRARKHAHPGTKPKSRPVPTKTVSVDPAQRSQLQDWSGSGDTYRADVSKPMTRETEAQKAARLAQYGYGAIDTGATKESIREHETKLEAHHKEQVVRAAKQETFEAHGKRQIAPLQETRVPDMPAPPTPQRTSLRPGTRAQMAGILRKRELQSAVVGQTPVAAPAPKQVVQTQQPRDLTKMGQRNIEAEKQAQFESGGRQQFKEAQQKAAFDRRKADFEHQQQQKFMGDQAERQLFQYMAGRHQGARDVQPIALKDPISKAYEQQRIKAVRAETQAMSEEEKYYAQKQDRQQQETEIQQHHAKFIKMRQDLHGKEEERYWSEREGKHKLQKEVRQAFATQQEIAAMKPDTGIPAVSHIYGMEEDKIKRNKKVVESIRAAGGARDVLHVVPDVPAKPKVSYAETAAQQGLKTFREQPTEITRAHFKKEKRPLSRTELEMPEATRSRIKGPTQGAILEHTAVGTKHGMGAGMGAKKRRRGGVEEEAPSLTVPAQLKQLQQAERSFKRTKGTAAMKQQMRARAPEATGGQSEGQRILESVTSLIREQHAKPAPSVLNVQSNDPTRPQTSATEPDANVQDPAIAAAAPPATGQESEMSSAVQNASAADNDLRQLDVQLGGGGGSAEMGTQAGAQGGGAPLGTDEVYGFPEPPATFLGREPPVERAKKSMFGPSGGIAALEQEREKTDEPSPEQAHRTTPTETTQSEQLEQLRNQPSDSKSSDQLAAEAVLTERAKQHVRDLRRTPVHRRTPTQVEQIKKTTSLLEKEEFEEELFRTADIPKSDVKKKPVAVRPYDPRSRTEEKQEERERQEEKEQNVPSLLRRRKSLFSSKKGKEVSTHQDPRKRSAFTPVAKSRVRTTPTTGTDDPSRTRTRTDDPTKAPQRARTGTDDPTKARTRTRTDDPSRTRTRTDDPTKAPQRAASPPSRKQGSRGTTTNPATFSDTRDPVQVRDRPRSPSAPPAQQPHRDPRRLVQNPTTTYTNNPTNNPSTTTTTSTNPQISTNPQFTPTTTTNPQFNPTIETGPVGGGEGGSVGPVDASGRGGTTGPVSMGGHGGMHLNMSGGWGGGGGGAVAAASSSGAGSGGGQGGAQQAVGTILAALKKKKKKQSGITAAKKRYTDKRKVKFAELRALKAKRLREHATKTKKLPKKERDKQRREYKAKVNAQYKEVTKRFPPARGLKDLKTVKDLIAKLDRVRLPS